MATTVEPPRPHGLGLAELLRRGSSGRRLTLVAGSVAVMVGVWLRFYCPSALWLDEAISVNISKLPLSQIPHALSQDGAPPLYYVLLHFWMDLFGRGNVAVRALSGVESLAALPLFWFAGNRLGGRRVAWITFFLGLSSPFAIYYATDTRMYSQMVLLCLLGYLALARALEAPTPRRLVALCVVTAAILYTHYWGLYLIGVTGLWLLYQLWRNRRSLPASVDAAAAGRCFVAMFVGGLLFLPWAPIFLLQMLHTGTPWTSAAGPADLLGTFQDFAGVGPWADLLAYGYFALIVLGVFGRKVGRTRSGDATSLDDAAAGADPDRAAGGSELTGLEQLEEPDLALGSRARLRSAADRAVGFIGFGPGGAGAAGRREAPGHGVTLVLQPNRRALPVFAVLVGTLVVAVVGGAAVQAAFVARYAAAVLPLFLLLVALGVGVLSRPRLVGGALAVLCVAGLLTGYGNNGDARTQAVQVASILNQEARPGDLVVFCPDQLGPAVNRLVDVPGLQQLTFPRAIGPQRVDWYDYKKVIARTNVETFAQDMLADVAPGHSLWLVWRNGYPGLAGDCGELNSWFSLLAGPGVQLVSNNPGGYYEFENLTHYPAT